MKLFYLHVSLATGSLLNGIFSVVYCSLFYPSGLGIWNALILYVVGFYGLCAYKPGTRVIFASHMLLLLVAVATFAISCLGIHCARGKCRRFWSHATQAECLVKFYHDYHYTTTDTAKIQATIHGMMLLEAIIQITVSLYILWFRLLSFWASIQSALTIYLAISMLSFLSFCMGTAYTVYCGQMFYLGAGVLLPIGIFTLSAALNYYRKKLRDRQICILVSMVLVMAMLLSVQGGYGVYCWHPVTDNTTQPRRIGCGYNVEVYERCYHRLQVMGYWHRSFDPNLLELKRDQNGFSVMLILLTLPVVVLASLVINRKRNVNNMPVELYEPVPL